MSVKSCIFSKGVIQSKIEFNNLFMMCVVVRIDSPRVFWVGQIETIMRLLLIIGIYTFSLLHFAMERKDLIFDV